MWRGAPGPLLSFLFSRLQHLSQRSFHFPKKFQLRKKIPENITSKIFKPQKFSSWHIKDREIKNRRRNFEEFRKTYKGKASHLNLKFYFKTWQIHHYLYKISDDGPVDIAIGVSWWISIRWRVFSRLNSTKGSIFG